MESPTDVGRDIYTIARRLIDAVELDDRGVRLLGVGVTGLTDPDTPRQLAVDRGARWDELADAGHEVRERFGADSVEPARLRTERVVPSTGNENPSEAYND